MIWSLQSVPELSDEQFEQWSKLLEQRAGIFLGGHQRTFLQTQLSMRMRELGQSDFGEYFNTVAEGVNGKVEWAMLVDRLVVKETSFFRDEASLQFVSRYCSDLISKRGGDKGIDVWSVGCSTGEEPYCLAMMVNNAFQAVNLDPLFGVTATDISHVALATAREGVYTPRKVERISEVSRRRYFKERDDGKFQVVPELRERICFSQGNVLNIEKMPIVNMDVIYTQNLLIYFRRWVRKNIMNEFVSRLKPGGVIVIGLGEVVDWSHPKMTRLPLDAVQAYVHK